MPISRRRKTNGFIMTPKPKTELFSQMIENFGSVIFVSLTPVFSFVTFHLKEKTICFVLDHLVLYSIRGGVFLVSADPGISIMQQLG